MPRGAANPLLTLTLNLTRTRALPPTLTVTLALTLIPTLALTLTLTPSLTLTLTLTRFLEALLEDALPPPLAALPRDLAELPPTAAPAAGYPSPNPQLIPTPTPNLTFCNLPHLISFLPLPLALILDPDP